QHPHHPSASAFCNDPNAFSHGPQPTPTHEATNKTARQPTARLPTTPSDTKATPPQAASQTSAARARQAGPFSEKLSSIRQAFRRTMIPHPGLSFHTQTASLESTSLIIIAGNAFKEDPWRLFVPFALCVPRPSALKL